MTKKELSNMATKELIKCEGCGGYHPLEESEVVIIKVIKGKNCEMPKAEASRPAYLDQPKSDPRLTQVKEHEPVPMPAQPPQIRKRIIPPGLAAMMMPPTHPQFESQGAKEFRTA